MNGIDEVAHRMAMHICACKQLYGLSDILFIDNPLHDPGAFHAHSMADCAEE